MRLSAMPLLLLALLALGGCNRFGTPQDAYTSFHKQVQRREFDKAYAALSQPTRDALAARAKAVSEASGGAVKPDPKALFFANAAPLSDVTGVTLLRAEGDVATVRVLSSSNQSSEVRMVREPSGWKVDLVSSLQP